MVVAEGWAEVGSRTSSTKEERRKESGRNAKGDASACNMLRTAPEAGEGGKASRAGAGAEGGRDGGHGEGGGGSGGGCSTGKGGDDRRDVSVCGRRVRATGERTSGSGEAESRQRGAS